MPTAFVRLTGFVAGLMLAGASPALAEQGQPVPWQLGFQPAATPIMEQITSFHNFVTIIIVLIALFVLGLLVYVMLRFNETKNPLPSKTHHNTPLEIAWTVIPIIILVAIAIPSFRLLFAQYDPPPADLTIKAIGSQWYWTYEYPDHDDLTFDSIMLEDDELEEGQPRLLAVDHDVVVPVNATVHVLLTANDVIHAWAIPAFGVKVDAVPGRLTKLWFRAEETGMFYGQCSELCGQRHAFMPIAVRVVSQEEFDAWVSEQQTAARTDKDRDVASAPTNAGSASNLVAAE